MCVYLHIYVYVYTSCCVITLHICSLFYILTYWLFSPSFFFLDFFFAFFFSLHFLALDRDFDENDDVKMSSRVHRAFPSSENAPLLVASSKSRIGQNTTKASNTTTLRDDDDNGETSFSSSSAMIKRGGRAIGIIVAFFILGAGCVVGMSSRVSQKGVVEEGFVAKAKTTIVSSSNNNNNDDDCLLYTSPSPRDRTRSRMPSSA